MSPSVGDIVIKPEYFSHILLWDKFSEIIRLLFPYQKDIFKVGSEENTIWVNHLPVSMGS